MGQKGGKGSSIKLRSRKKLLAGKKTYLGKEATLGGENGFNTEHTAIREKTNQA